MSTQYQIETEETLEEVELVQPVVKPKGKKKKKKKGSNATYPT